jgi:GT2 family glycosyltransferase
MPTISVIICTRNRHDELRCALVGLSAATVPSLTVLVSDDSPEDDRRTETVCAHFPDVIYQRGPRRGLAANRNAAIKSIAHGWLHFIDDDVIVPPEFHANATASIARLGCSRAVITGGERKYAHGPAEIPDTVERPFIGVWAHAEMPGSRLPNSIVINASLFPRILFESIRFDERLTYGCEEFDIALHAQSIGYCLVFDSTLWVDHYPSATARQERTPVVTTSAVYAGLKRHAIYSRSPSRFAIFVLLAVPRLWLNALRTSGASGAATTLIATARGFIKFAQYLKTGREELA